MSELTSRQWALYEEIKARGDSWTTQRDIARALWDKGYYHECVSTSGFHNSAARMQMTNDIRAINNSAVIQKIIITSKRGVKLATQAEFDTYIAREISAVVEKLNRAKRKALKGNRNGQMRIVFNSERDTVQAFILSENELSQRLIEARTNAGLKQKDTVALLKSVGSNIDEAMLSKFEHGYCLPTKTTLKQLAAIYGVSAAFFGADEELIKKGRNAAQNDLQAAKMGE